MMQNSFEFLRSRVFALQLLIATVFLTLVFVFTYKWLNAYTKHGETVTVPDVRNMKIANLEKFLKDRNLNFKVADSSVYIIDKAPGLVVEQDPLPNAHVKENRTIYVTITRTVPPRVIIPNLIDVSQRQAEAILASYGLKTGKITYAPDLAKNAVLAMSVSGRAINSGDQVAKGSIIDLVLGDGLGNTNVAIPKLEGLTYEEAIFVLNGSGLTAGAVTFDSSVSDSTEAIVYRQLPEFGDTTSLKQGESVDLFLK